MLFVCLCVLCVHVGVFAAIDGMKRRYRLPSEVFGPTKPRRSPGVAISVVCSLCWGTFFGGIASARPPKGEIQSTANSITLALVIGSNPGGPGQQSLRYAEADAGRMAALLTELGRMDRQRVVVLTRPTASEVRTALSDLGRRLSRLAADGRRTRVVFYYSGHARAQALNLGPTELPLKDLRTALTALPADFKLVVIDACQSGAFSGVKGARPAADFTHNTMTSLSTTGMAVMASSSGDELSQESAQLQGSYFSHHLVAALRGAGDRNRDARVSLDEAYRYAYEHTLADTSRTAVGGQHVTLETDLRGKGEVPLSYPIDARAQLRLPDALYGEVLVQQAPAGAVMVELHKARGSALTLALPPGDYDATVRTTDDRVYGCKLSLADALTTALSLDLCAPVEPELQRVKGEQRRGDAALAFFAEAGLADPQTIHDRYVDRLGDFALGNSSPGGMYPLVRAGLMLSTHFGLQLEVRTLESQQFTSTIYDAKAAQRDGGPREFLFRSYAAQFAVRTAWPILDDYVLLSAFAGGGLGVALSEYRQAEEEHWGPVLHAGAQVALQFGAIGAFVEVGTTYAPLLPNLLTDVHNSGGRYFALGLRVQP